MVHSVFSFYDTLVRRLPRQSLPYSWTPWSSSLRLGLLAATLLLDPSELRVVGPQVRSFVVPAPTSRHPPSCFRGSRHSRALRLLLFITTECIFIASCFVTRLLSTFSYISIIYHSAFKEFMIAMTWSGPFSAPSYLTRSFTAVVNPGNAVLL